MPNIKEPLVSVIVPVYNVEKYIARCLESIIGQSYKNLEIIIVNDGSTDSSGKIADDYALKDSRIKVIHKKNEGVSAARNAALDIASGEYINMVDSDDWIELDTYAAVMENAVKYNSDMICWAYFEVNGGVKLPGEEKLPGEVKLPVKIGFPSGYIDGKLKEQFVYNYIAGKTRGFYICTSMFKREIIEKYRIRMHKDISFQEDIVFNIYYLLHSDSLYLMSQRHLYNYFQHENSATKKYRSKLDSYLAALKQIEHCIENNPAFASALPLRACTVIFYQTFGIADTEETFAGKVEKIRLLMQSNQITHYLQEVKFRDFLSVKTFAAFLAYKGFIRITLLYIALLKTAHRIIRSLALSLRA